MMYEYKCPTCDRRALSQFRGDRLDFGCVGLKCQWCGAELPGGYVRVFSFSVTPVMEEHFNHSVSKPIRTMKQYKDELKYASERATLETGMEHNYVPNDPDPASVGVTGEGIYESNVVREREGVPLLPDIFGV